jgi:hypothetical protein
MSGESDREAFKYGERVEEAMNARLDECFATRYASISGNYLEVLRGLLRDCIQQMEAPPIYAARADFDAFRENVDALVPKVTSELEEDMREWLNAMQADRETSALFGQLIQQRVSDYTLQLTLDGMNVLADYSVPLHDADRSWRAANPCTSFDSGRGLHRFPIINQ